MREISFFASALGKLRKGKRRGQGIQSGGIGRKMQRRAECLEKIGLNFNKNERGWKTCLSGDRRVGNARRDFERARDCFGTGRDKRIGFPTPRLEVTGGGARARVWGVRETCSG